MFAIIRRYEAIDQARASELVEKADETLLPSPTELPGFSGLLPHRGRQTAS